MTGKDAGRQSAVDTAKLVTLKNSILFYIFKSFAFNGP